MWERVCVYEETETDWFSGIGSHNCKGLASPDSADGVGQYVGESEGSSSWSSKAVWQNSFYLRGLSLRSTKAFNWLNETHIRCRRYLIYSKFSTLNVQLIQSKQTKPSQKYPEYGWNKYLGAMVQSCRQIILGITWREMMKKQRNRRHNQEG